MESGTALKCQVCGNEVDLPFQCSYCQAYFCNKHRLPESHECSNMPREPPPYISTTYVEPKDKIEFKEKLQTKKPFPVKKVIGLFLVVIIIGALLWYAPTIISYIQNLSSQPTDSSDESSYTNMTLRDLPLNRVNNTIVQFGDTEYSFRNLMGYLMVYAPFQSKTYIPTEGKTYRDLGIEIKVSKVGSDYISSYIVILVKPTIQNYMASLHYTKVRMALYETKAVNISSGLINKTNQYWFTYTQVTHTTFSEPKLTIRTTSQSKEYIIYEWTAIREFEIQTRVYKIESGYMVIYVKPLY